MKCQRPYFLDIDYICLNSNQDPELGLMIEIKMTVGVPVSTEIHFWTFFFAK